MDLKPPSSRRPVIRAALLLLALPIVPALLSGWLHPRRPDWHAIRTEAAAPAPDRLDLSTIRAAHPDALWLDARSAEDYTAAHVPGALPLTEESWDAQFSALIDAWDGSQSLVVYCGGESCRASEAVARRLRRELGVDNVFVLAGGWDAWRAAEDKETP